MPESSEHSPREFVALVEHGERFYTRRGVQICFADRVAAIWGDDGPNVHAAIIGLDELFTRSADHLAGPDADDLRPILERLRAGGDPEALRAEAIACYTRRHGVGPTLVMWPQSGR